MEPLNDRELDEVLSQWRAPLPSQALDTRMRRATRKPWSHWLWTGSVRVPVPVLFAVLVVVVFLFVFGDVTPVRKSQAGFQPVKEVQVRIVRSNYEVDR